MRKINKQKLDKIKIQFINQIYFITLIINLIKKNIIKISIFDLYYHYINIGISMNCL